MKTAVTIAGVTFQNPVMTGSGTFGSGIEYSEFVDLNRLGAVVTKGVANVPWPGNPDAPRGGGLRRHVKCHRTAEPGNRCVY